MINLALGPEISTCASSPVVRGASLDSGMDMVEGPHGPGQQDVPADHPVAARLQPVQLVDKTSLKETNHNPVRGRGTHQRR